MAFKNDKTAAGVVLVVASTNEVNYCALQVVTTSDLTFTDSRGTQTALVGVPAGTRIDCQVTKVTVASGSVLGYVA